MGEDGDKTEWTTKVRWRDLGLFALGGVKAVRRAAIWLYLAVINVDRWDRKATARVWGRISGSVRRYYLVPVLLIAGALIPLWLYLLWELSGNLITQLADPMPDLRDGTARRAYFYGIGLTITGLGALLAAPFILIKAWVNERNTIAGEQGLITDRFTKAVGQLGEEKTVKVQTLQDPRDEKGRFQERVLTIERTEPNIEVRLGAIYALERIARDSERDHVPVMETLCAYIRENARSGPPRDFPLPSLEDEDEDAPAAVRETRIATRRLMQQNRREVFGEAQPLRADVQAALRVIERRTDRQKEIEGEEFRLDLRRANLQSLDLASADLRLADLSQARLEGADLVEARLEGADLRRARLEGADLRWARLEGADLIGARLEGADLFGARLEGASFRMARLEGADLRMARLEGAVLVAARLERASLFAAGLEGADLRRARLEGALLLHARLEGADLSEAQLESTDLSLWSCARTRLRSVDFRACAHFDPGSVTSAFGVREGIGRTLLPDGAEGPAHWHVAAETDEDGPKHWQAFDADYDAWVAKGCPTGADWRDES